MRRKFGFFGSASAGKKSAYRLNFETVQSRRLGATTFAPPTDFNWPQL